MKGATGNIVLNPGDDHGVEVPARLLVKDPAAVRAGGEAGAALMDVAPEINKLQNKTRRLAGEVDNTEARTMDNAEAITDNAAAITTLAGLVTTLTNQQTVLVDQMTQSNAKHDEVVAQLKADAAQQSADIQALTAQLAAGGGGGSSSVAAGASKGSIAFPGRWGTRSTSESGSDTHHIHLKYIYTADQESAWAAKFAGIATIESNIVITCGDPARISQILKDVEVIFGYLRVDSCSSNAAAGTLRLEKLRTVQSYSNTYGLITDNHQSLTALEFPNLKSVNYDGRSYDIRICNNAALKTISMPNIVWPGVSAPSIYNNPLLVCAGVAPLKQATESVGNTWRTGSDYNC